MILFSNINKSESEVARLMKSGTKGYSSDSDTNSPSTVDFEFGHK